MAQALCKTLYGVHADTACAVMTEEDYAQLRVLLSEKEEEFLGGGGMWSAMHQVPRFLQQLLRQLAHLGYLVVSGSFVRPLYNAIRSFLTLPQPKFSNSTRRAMQSVVLTSVVITMQDKIEDMLWMGMAHAHDAAAHFAARAATPTVLAATDAAGRVAHTTVSAAGAAINHLRIVAEAELPRMSETAWTTLQSYATELQEALNSMNLEVAQGVLISQATTDAIAVFVRIAIKMLRMCGWKVRDRTVSKTVFLSRWVGNVVGMLVAFGMSVQSGNPMAPLAMGLVAAVSLAMEAARVFLGTHKSGVELVGLALNAVVHVIAVDLPNMILNIASRRSRDEGEAIFAGGAAQDAVVFL